MKHACVADLLSESPESSLNFSVASVRTFLALSRKSAAVVISFNMASSSSNDNSNRLWTSSKLVKRLSNSSMAALNLTTLSSGSSKVVAKFLHSRIIQPLHTARLRLSSSDMFTSTKSLFPVRFMKSFPVRCSVRTNPSKVTSKHRTADLCPTCIKFPYVNINTAGIHSPLQPPSCPGTTPRGPRPPDSPAREIQNDGPRTTAR